MVQCAVRGCVATASVSDLGRAARGRLRRRRDDHPQDTFEPEGPAAQTSTT